jgi:hypothetical protein
VGRPDERVESSPKSYLEAEGSVSVETGGLEKENGHFANRLKIQLTLLPAVS